MDLTTKWVDVDLRQESVEPTLIHYGVINTYVYLDITLPLFGYKCRQVQVLYSSKTYIAAANSMICKYITCASILATAFCLKIRAFNRKISRNMVCAAHKSYVPMYPELLRISKV